MLNTPGSMSSIISWKWDKWAWCGLVPACRVSDRVAKWLSTLASKAAGFCNRNTIYENIWDIYICMFQNSSDPFLFMKTAQFLLQTNHWKESSLEPFTTTIHLQMFTNHRFLVETSGRRHDVSVSSRSGDAARARGFKGLRHKGHVCAVRNQLAKQPRWKTWRLVAQGANTISSEPEKSDKQMAQELASTTQQRPRDWG